MAQASSVQREPSMEEILASIRRIIEDNEAGRQDEGPEAATDAIENAAADVETFRAELQVANTQPEADQAEETAQTGRAFGNLETFPRERPAPEQPPESRGMHSDPEPAAQGDAPPSGIASFSAHARDETTAERAEHDDVSQSSSSALQPHEDSRPAPEEGRDGFRQAIVSEASGRKVAAAFSELSDAFEATRRKSLAEAAEEMLRPMLQEWLDNNLPQLVERLVREEIERIARG